MNGPAELFQGLESATARERAWDLFLTRYRRLIFAAIRHYVQAPDDVMDVFARVCERLREDEMRRLRSYFEQPTHRARFSTWLVAVVRNLTVDWLRCRDGRQRLPAFATRLPPLRRRIFEHVFLNAHGHVETYEQLRVSDAPELTFREFLVELRATYRAAEEGRYGRALREIGGPPPPEPDSNPGAAGTLRLDDLRRVAARALEVLSDEDRLALELYVVEELPADRVATVLGLPNAKAVYNRVYRALASAREHLDQAGIGPADLW